MGTIRIPLHSRKYPNLYALIDEEDAELVSQHRWRPHFRAHCFYAKSNDGAYMHRLLLNPSADEIIDHRNRDGLDNRRANIHIATPGINARNTRPHRKSSSRFKNVAKARNRWEVRIVVDGTCVNLGHYLSEELAAHVVDRYLRHAVGESAFLNFPNLVLPDDYIDGWIKLDRMASEQLRRSGIAAFHAEQRTSKGGEA